jgi:hypothetical protein
MKRENIPTFVNELPATVTDDTIVTLMLPLKTARVGPISTQLANLVGTYGSVTALEPQNSLILVETAGQVRRMLKMIESIDHAEPDNEVRFYPLRHAKANTLIASLSSLIGQRQIEYVIGADGKKTKIEESKMEGLSMTADERTNAIVARGVRSRLLQLADVIELLDVPSGGSAGAGVPGAPAAVTRSVRTVMLRGGLQITDLRNDAGGIGVTQRNQRDGLRINVINARGARDAAITIERFDQCGTFGNALRWSNNR